MKKLMQYVVSTIAVFALLIGTAPIASAGQKILLGTSQPGGATFEVGVAMSKVINDGSGGKLNVEAAVTGGSTGNVRTLQKKNKMQPFRVGMGTAPAVSWGQTGRKPFKKPMDVLALGALYPLTVVYATHKTSGIKKWSDLAGRKFVVGGRGGSIYIVTQLALGISGVKAKREFFNNNQNSAAIKDQRVDAGFFFLNGGIPAPAYMDLSRVLSGKLHFFGPDEKTIATLAKNEAGLVRDVVAAGSITGYNKDIVSWGQMWALMASSKMSNDTAYTFVKSLYDNASKISKYHPVGKHVKKSTGMRGLAKVKVHPGAMRYWKENGVKP